MSFQPCPTAATAGGAHPVAREAGQIAIVGCGPTGCYTALALLRLVPDVRITVFDARPTPFGLVRFGVAPDHQGMKNVSKQFDRLFASERVDFVGSTVIGRDVPYSALEANFDVVVLATGLAEDRSLEVPVDPRARVIGAGQLLRLLNSDPDSILRASGLAPLGTDVLVFGTGNVAMDVARLLCKGDAGFHGSDVDDDARAALKTSELRTLTVLSRGPRDRVRWDASMFAELCALPDVSVYLDGERIEKSDTADANGLSEHSVRVDVRFNEIAVAIDSDDGQCIVRTRSSLNGTAPEDCDGEFIHRVDSVITAMGFVASPGGCAPEMEQRIVRVGGCSSGTLGNLAENRAHAKTAAQEISKRLPCDRSVRPGLAGVRELCSAATSFDEWTTIDQAETLRARPNRLRTKFTSWSAMSEVIADHRRSVAASSHRDGASDD